MSEGGTRIDESMWWYAAPAHSSRRVVIPSGSMFGSRPPLTEAKYLRHWGRGGGGMGQAPTCGGGASPPARGTHFQFLGYTHITHFWGSGHTCDPWRVRLPGACPASKSMTRPFIPMLYPQTSLPPPAKATSPLPSRGPRVGGVATSPLPSRGSPARRKKKRGGKGDT